MTNGHTVIPAICQKNTYFINETQQIQSFSKIQFCRVQVVVTDVHLTQNQTRPNESHQTTGNKCIQMPIIKTLQSALYWLLHDGTADVRWNTQCCQ